MDVVETQYQRHEHHQFNEREKDSAERTAEEVGLCQREMRVRRGEEENEARAKQLAEENAKSSEESQERYSWLDRGPISMTAVNSRCGKNEKREE